MKTNSDYELFSITMEHYAEVMKFTKYFTLAQPLCIHLATTPEQFMSGHKQLITHCCQSGLSFGLRKGEDIVSVVLSLGYVSNQQPFDFNAHFTSIRAMLQKAQEGYTPNNKEKTVSVFIVSTHPQHTSKGLCYKLLLHLEKQAKAKGFEQIQADCTNPFSERAFLKAGYTVVNRLQYNNFKFEDEIPFKQMKGSDGVSVVVKHI